MEELDLGGLFAGVGLFGMLIYFAVFAFYLVAFWKLFEKAGIAGWKSLVPYYSNYLMFKMAWGNGWLFLTLLIPFVSFVTLAVCMYKLALSFGKSTGFGIANIFLSGITIPILAFGKDTYCGPAQ